jgi:hypothetical protein
MPTSGMPMPALSASLRTVASSHASSALRGWSMMTMPVLHLAIGLLMSSEMNAPTKADHQREDGQRRHIQPVGGEEPIHPEDAGGDQQHRHDGEVGQNQQQNAFHGVSSLRNVGW